MRRGTAIRKIALLTAIAELTAAITELLIVRFTSVSLMSMSYVSFAVAAVWLALRRRSAKAVPG